MREPNGSEASSGGSHSRVLALDWLRGIVMVLMALDHVDAATNPRHAQGDSAQWRAGEALSAPDFLTRWCTHLCAPTFFLLCGAGIALSRARSMERGEPARGFDRHLLARGLVLVLLEVSLVSHYWRSAEGVAGAVLPVFLQVLYALGIGMMLMVPLRRLSLRAQVFAAAAILLAAEVIHRLALPQGLHANAIVQWLFVGGMQAWKTPAPGEIPFDVLVLYPVLPWLPAMLIGHALGWALSRGGVAPHRLLTGAGCALLLFVGLRFFDGFGNMALHRRDDSLLEWLHCSKYPPSITFLAMELAIALALLAGLLRAQGLLQKLPTWNPIAVLGETALFFYLLHLPMIGALIAVGALPGHGEGSAAQSWAGMLLVALCCWPLCAVYRLYKRRFGHRWTRYL